MKKKFRAHTKLFVSCISVISVALVLVIAANAYRDLSAMSANNHELYSAYRISELMKSFRATLVQLENKKKGYLITGDAKFMEQYVIRENEAKTLLKTMETYFEGKPEEPHFKELKTLTYERLTQNKSFSSSSDVKGFATGNIEGNAGITETIASEINDIAGRLDARTSALINNNKAFLSEFRKWLLFEVLFVITVVVAGVILVFRDINIRMKLETDLRTAKKQADDNARIKEQFLANMSHEIRTPLNAIIGFADLMRKSELQGAHKEYVEAIRTSGSSLLNIINDILDYSRLEAGKVPIEKIVFSVRETMESIRTIFAQKASEKGLLLSMNVEDNVPAIVFGDPHRLTQILTNLIGNAIKFTQHGKVELHCSATKSTNETADIRFILKDTGIGIPAEKLEGIFERFNQGNSETTRQFGGTGLGLAIVKNLVEIQDGTINVKSKHGAGSQFEVTIPYSLAVTVPEPRAEQRSPGPATTKTAKVLLAEDNELNQLLATRYLESFGYTVTLATNGEEAVNLLKHNSFDIVLMDIQMPVMDGYSAATLIRNDLKLDVPVIAMTARAIPGEKERCIASGMNDYILKPFREEELRSLTEQYLNRSKSRQKFESEAVTDLADLESTARGNKNFMIEMMELFIERNPADLREMDLSIRDKNFKETARIAHKMKTSVGFTGLKKLLPCLAEMEELCDRHDSGVTELFQWLSCSCERARAEFMGEIKRLMVTTA
jgi:signal transduction histidine kinase/CheY-like chemotaxis protein/HPt (histidine-containing phosphotransfer) domain-containing protein